MIPFLHKYYQGSPEFWSLLKELGANSLKPLTAVFNQGRNNFLLLPDPKLDNWFQNGPEATEPKIITDEFLRKLSGFMKEESNEKYQNLVTRALSEVRAKLQSEQEPSSSVASTTAFSTSTTTTPTNLGEVSSLSSSPQRLQFDVSVPLQLIQENGRSYSDSREEEEEEEEEEEQPDVGNETQRRKRRRPHPPHHLETESSFIAESEDLSMIDLNPSPPQHLELLPTAVEEINMDHAPSFKRSINFGYTLQVEKPKDPPIETLEDLYKIPYATWPSELNRFSHWKNYLLNAVVGHVQTGNLFIKFGECEWKDLKGCLLWFSGL